MSDKSHLSHDQNQNAVGLKIKILRATVLVSLLLSIAGPLLGTT